MWSSSNDTSITNIAGDRSLGDLTEKQRRVQLLYQLAQEMSVSDPASQIFGDINPRNDVYQLGEGDATVAMAYGLKPYIVAPQSSPKGLVATTPQQRQPSTLGGSMNQGLLKMILRKIVEEA